MSHEIKVIAMDLDGTLTHEQGASDKVAALL